MTKKIILHIGFGKTGTSSIQGMLFNNREKLKEHGVFYPKTGIIGTAHHQLADFKATDMSESISGIYKSVLDEFSMNKCRAMVLSSEHFCFCRPRYISAMAKILNGWDVEVLFYVRRQVELIPSAFMQKIKVGEGAASNWNINKYIKQSKDAFDFNIRIKGWGSEFGEKAIKVRLYGDIKGKYDVCSDFLTAIDFKEKLDAPASRANTSLLPEFINLVKLIDISDCGDKYRNAAIYNLVEISEELKSSSKNILDLDLTAYINDYYKDSNRRFEKSYMLKKYSLDKPS